LLDQFTKQPLVQRELTKKKVENFDLRMRTKAEEDPVVAPAFPFGRDDIEPAQIQQLVREALQRSDQHTAERPVALTLHWEGSATYLRLHAICLGILNGMSDHLDRGHPLVLVCDRDIGGLLGLPHGLTIGLVLAETMDRDRRFAAGQFERVADALGEPDDGSGDGSRAVRAVRRILTELEFETLSAVGVREQHLDQLATQALDDYFISVAPAPWSHDEVMAALRAGLALGESRESR